MAYVSQFGKRVKTNRTIRTPRAVNLALLLHALSCFPASATDAQERQQSPADAPKGSVARPILLKRPASQANAKTAPKIPSIRGYGAADLSGCGGTPLNIFVASELDASAQRVMNRDYIGALAQLKSAKLLHPQALRESHYIRGLCFQALGDFDKSLDEFRAASAVTADEELRRRCSLGVKQALAKHSRVSDEQLFLWDFGQAGQGDVFMLRRY